MPKTASQKLGLMNENRLSAELQYIEDGMIYGMIWLWMVVAKKMKIPSHQYEKLCFWCKENLESLR